MAGGPAGGQHCPASSQALLGPSSCSGWAGTGCGPSRRRQLPPTQHTSAGLWCASLQCTASAPHTRTPHSIQSCSPQHSQGKGLGKQLGRQSSEQDPQNLLEIVCVLSTQQGTLNKHKTFHLIRTHCNVQFPCDKQMIGFFPAFFSPPIII